MFLIRLTTALLLIFCVRGTAQEKKEFTISGKIDGIGNTKVLLGNKPNGYTGGFKVRYFDSCMSVNDQFTFKGHVDELAFYSIEVPGKARGWVTFILENRDIKITGSKDSIYKATVTGSPEYDTYKHYKNEIYLPVTREVGVYHDMVDSLRKKGDLDEVNRIEQKIIAPYYRKIEADMFRFVEENPGRFAALYELNSFAKQVQIPVDSTKKYFSVLSDEMKNNKIGKRLKYWLFEYPQLIGDSNRILNFPLPDTAGHMRELSEFRGEYVLLDFWASWCGPCIDELPGVKRIDSLYGSKGLQVLGISLDTKKELWRQAITNHHITWPNLSDLEGAAGAVSSMLSITAIPAKFLIGPRGNIILKNASLPEIEKFLENKLVN